MFIGDFGQLCEIFVLDLISHNLGRSSGSCVYHHRILHNVHVVIVIGLLIPINGIIGSNKGYFAALGVFRAFG